MRRRRQGRRRAEAEAEAGAGAGAEAGAEANTHLTSSFTPQNGVCADTACERGDEHREEATLLLKEVLALMLSSSG